MFRRFLIAVVLCVVSCAPQRNDVAIEAESPRFEAFEQERVENTNIGDDGETETEVKKPAEKKPVETKKPVRKAKPKVTYKPSKLQIVANFDKADATVNGLPYPEYDGTKESEGMVLPAGGPYTVVVKQGAKSKTYRLHLRPYETRMLFVELSGLNKSAPTPKKAPAKKETKKKVTKKDDKKKEDDKKGPGKVTVYAKPAGTIIADGKKLGEKTPGTVELENGRHEIQVEYDGGEVSEKKIVRVRDGSKIKLFFRQRKK